MGIRSKLIILLLLGALLTACGNTPSPLPVTLSVPPTPAQTDQAQPPPTRLAPTATAAPPTSTPEPPAAARVNGEIITLEAFQKELARYQAGQRALGNEPVAGETLYQTIVLDALIGQLLVEQAAAAGGVSISDEELEAELQRLIEAPSRQQSFEEWLEMNQYSAEEFRTILHSQMIAQAMIEQVMAAVPDTPEQVHARHIVVDSAELAESVLAQLQEGTDFATLAIEYSLDESTRLNGGDLDFFPRDLLLSPEVEEVAFTLEPGEVSGLLKSDFGYHIVQVIEKDPARLLTPEVQQRLRTVTFERWLQQLWATATIERYI